MGAKTTATLIRRGYRGKIKKKNEVYKNLADHLKFASTGENQKETHQKYRLKRKWKRGYRQSTPSLKSSSPNKTGLDAEVSGARKN